MASRKGVLNKATVERTRLATAALGKPVSPNAKLAKEVLEEAMMHFRALASRHQPRYADDGKLLKGDETKFERYMKIAGEMADRLAPYQSPRLAAIAVQQLPPMLPEEMTDDQLRAAVEFERAIAFAGGDGGRAIKTIN